LAIAEAFKEQVRHILFHLDCEYFPSHVKRAAKGLPLNADTWKTKNLP
jgi:hypothetical protein